jgi:hypothetical protein
VGRFNGNNIRKRPKIGNFSGPIETFQCIRSNRNFDVKIWKVFIYLHLRLSWKLKKLCRVDFIVFESWQTAVKSPGKTITSSAVCHDSKTKKSTRQSFFNFQENLNEGK